MSPPALVEADPQRGVVSRCSKEGGCLGQTHGIGERPRAGLLVCDKLPMPHAGNAKGRSRIPNLAALG